MGSVRAGTRGAALCSGRTWGPESEMPPGCDRASERRLNWGAGSTDWASGQGGGIGAT